MTTILIVDDEQNMRQLIDLVLVNAGFYTVHAANGTEAYQVISQQTIDLVLLDVMMPGENGFEVCQAIQAMTPVPVIFLTARDASEDKVKGLMLGGDDYIVKPFAIEELLARIRSILRRVKPNEQKDVLVVRNLEIDAGAYEVTFEGQKLELTRKEYDLLKLLVENSNHVCTRDVILENVWGFETEVETNVVDVYIRHLRSKLQTEDSPYIETVRGVGYVVRT